MFYVYLALDLLNLGVSTTETRSRPHTLTTAWDHKLIVFRTSWRLEYESQIQILAFTAAQTWRCEAESGFVRQACRTNSDDFTSWE